MTLRPNFFAAVLSASSALLMTVPARGQSNPSPLLYEVRGKIEAGIDHTLALTSAGVLWSWGKNNYGQLGDGTNDDRSSPTHLIIGPFTGIRFKAISASNHNAAIDTSNRLWMWGRHHYGQLGDGTNVPNSTPRLVQLGASNTVKSVACGLRHTVAVDLSGNLWAWGSNGNGELGNGSTSSSKIPIQMIKPAGMRTIVQVAAGDNCSYAMDSSGKVWAWGNNGNGQLGIGNTTEQLLPVQMTGTLPSFRTLSVKGTHVAALGHDDSVWTWGNNDNGQLGFGNTIEKTQPTRLLSGVPAAQVIKAGVAHTLATSNTHRAWGWGNNGSGRIGDGRTIQRNSPVMVNTISGLVDVVDLAAGGSHSVALKHGGSLYAWGNGANGRLGTGTITTSYLPVLLSKLKLGNDDSDSDGMPDSWEKFYFGNLTKTATTDTDGDGLKDVDEYLKGTHPLVIDTDGDGISDGLEIANGLNPLNPDDAALDYDGDGLSNGEEVTIHQTDPLQADTSGDGLPDGWVVAHGFDPLANNADEQFGDSGVTNLEAFQAGVQAYPDSTLDDFDGDGIPNAADADPHDRIIDWRQSSRPSFGVIELDVDDVEHLSLNDLTEKGTALFSRIEDGAATGRIVVDRNRNVHPFVSVSPPSDSPPSEGSFTGYAPVLIGEKVPGYQIVGGFSEPCLWDPLAGTFTPRQSPSNYRMRCRTSATV